MSWLTTTAGAFDFLDDADAVLVSYLANDAPNSLSAYLAALNTLERSPYGPTVNDSPSLFPLCRVWTGAVQYRQPARVDCRTSIRVWVLGATPQAGAITCQNLAGAIASAIQQSRDTSGNDWADSFCIFDQPQISQPDVSFFALGDNQGLAQGSLEITWTYEESD